MIKNIIFVGLGGFAGSIARYLLSRLNNHLDWMSIPFGTLLVNVAGSFLIGILVGISEKSPLLTVELRMLLMVGLCGGFTTFSTFSNETLSLITDGNHLAALANIGLQLSLCLGAVWAGHVLAYQIWR